MFELVYVSPDFSTRFEMLQGEDGPFIVLDSLQGLVGEFSDTQIQTVGVPGARVDFRDRVVAPMTGGFDLVVTGVEQWLSVRKAFSTSKYGTLMLTVGAKTWSAKVRLSASLPSPGGRPHEGSIIHVQLVSDGEHGGLWFSTGESDARTVRVTNRGDVPVWPEIEWSGAGGVVTLPSGAQFELPSVSRAHVLPLARHRSGKVTSSRGYERAVTKKVNAVSESVPVGATRQFVLPEGAKLRWREGVLDPWV